MADDNRSRPEAIRVDALHKSFGSHHVLKGVSLTAHEGDVVAIIGGSGSGKSTMLRCINFLETPSSGQITVAGEAVAMRADGSPSDRKQIERIRQSLGMVFQSFNLWTHRTVLENLIEVPVHVLKCPRDVAEERARKLLARVGLAEKEGAYPAFMSGGQQQRAAIARALVQGAKVILADEPIASLDPESSRKVMDILARVNREDQCTVVVSLHQVNVAIKYCARTVALHQGKVVYDGPSVALTPTLLRELYGAEADDILALGDHISSLQDHKPAMPHLAWPAPVVAMAQAA